MKYVVELPDDIDRRLSQKASATGQDAAHLIRVAVGRFVNDEPATAASGTWSEEGETRRRALIDKDIAGSINGDELAELAQLDHLANEHFDRIAAAFGRGTATSRAPSPTTCQRKLIPSTPSGIVGNRLCGGTDRPVTRTIARTGLGCATSLNFVACTA